MSNSNRKIIQIDCAKCFTNGLYLDFFENKVVQKSQYHIIGKYPRKAKKLFTNAQNKKKKKKERHFLITHNTYYIIEMDFPLRKCSLATGEEPLPLQLQMDHLLGQLIYRPKFNSVLSKSDTFCYHSYAAVKN